VSSLDWLQQNFKLDVHLVLKLNKRLRVGLIFIHRFPPSLLFHNPRSLPVTIRVYHLQTLLTLSWLSHTSFLPLFSPSCLLFVYFIHQSTTRKRYNFTRKTQFKKQDKTTACIKWPTQGRVTDVYSQNVTQHTEYKIIKNLGRRIECRRCSFLSPSL